MTASEWAGWVGACTGVLSLGWNTYKDIYTRLTSGAKLRVTAFAGIVLRPAPPGDPRLLMVTVQNIGREPAAIMQFLLQIYPSRWARFRRRPSYPSEVLQLYQGPELPHKLDVASQFVASMVQDPKFDDWLSSDNLWCAVVHSVSKKPALAKVCYPQEWTFK